MKIIYNIEDFKPSTDSISLTIGNFDGVHLGHQAILSKLCDQKVVFTFSNHPLEVLKNRPCFRLTTSSHRLKLLSQHGVDTTIIVPFTEAFSKQSPEAFLKYLRTYVPFSHLTLGHDAVIGHGRKGDITHLHTLSKQSGFTLNYLNPIIQNGITVSSSVIRSHIQAGNFEQASLLLGRPYSILAPVEPGAQHGRLLGFHTANLKVHTLCLPPLGVYVVKGIINGKDCIGVANLGHAPTLHANRPAVLEVHFIDYRGELYEKEIEIFFLKFLRHEIRFDSIEALKKQIQLDVDSALAYSKESTD